MGDFSKALAPVVARTVQVVLGLLIAYGFWKYSPPEFKEWAFSVLDKYAPTISGWLK